MQPSSFHIPSVFTWVLLELSHKALAHWLQSGDGSPSLIGKALGRSSVLSLLLSPAVGSVCIGRSCSHCGCFCFQGTDSLLFDTSDDEELREQLDMHSIIVSCVNEEPLFTADQVGLLAINAGHGGFPAVAVHDNCWPLLLDPTVNSSSGAKGSL